MRDYIVKSNVELKFVCSMKVKSDDIFTAESKVKEIIKIAVARQLDKCTIINNLKDSEIPILIEITCITKDTQEVL